MRQTCEARLTSLATAVPAYALDQTAVRERLRGTFAQGESEVARLLPVFDNAGIATRYSCMPLDWYGTPVGWRERNGLYIRHAQSLLETAARRCLASAGLSATSVDAVVTVSTTGIATPSLDARLIGPLGLRPDVERLPVFGLGCCGGVQGLARAAALARARPGRRVLLLVVELCALTFRPTDLSKSNIVAAALFGDGAAAALVSTEEGDAKRLPVPAPVVSDWGEHTWPDSLDVMGWRVEDDGLGVLFSRDIPTLVREGFAPVMGDFLARNDVRPEALAATACHPGGMKVVDALESVVGLPAGGMTAARRVLRDYGNMSAPTVLFVLREVLRARPRGPILVSALGPGFTAGFVLLRGEG